MVWQRPEFADAHDEEKAGKRARKGETAASIRTSRCPFW
jgi:hypothetical protein